MKRLIVGLIVVVAVLLVASTSPAALVVSVDPPTIPLPGYEAYVIRVGGATTFFDINIQGTVVESSRFVVDEDYDPPRVEVVQTWHPGMPTSHKGMDTHFMFGTIGLLIVGESSIETNDAYWRAPADLIIPTVSGYMCGLGTFTSEPGASFSFAEPLPLGSPFMQIVIPAGTGVMLTGTTDGGGVIEQFVGTAVPEPSTLIIWSSLGAVGIAASLWRKRKAA